MYKIERITYKDDSERMDNIYQAIKGCVGNLNHIILGRVLWFDYMFDNEGNDKKGYFKTTMVESCTEYDNKAIVETLDSVYYFKMIDPLECIL